MGPGGALDGANALGLETSISLELRPEPQRGRNRYLAQTPFMASAGFRHLQTARLSRIDTAPSCNAGVGMFSTWRLKDTWFIALSITVRHPPCHGEGQQ